MCLSIDNVLREIGQNVFIYMRFKAVMQARPIQRPLGGWASAVNQLSCLLPFIESRGVCVLDVSCN